MVTGIGEGLRHMEKRYRVSYNKTTGTWRLLDTWHESMTKVVDWNSDIPDDCPALVIITDEGFTTLAMEAARLGILGKAVMPKEADPDIVAGIEAMKEDYHQLQEKYNKVVNENQLITAEVKGIGSELLDMQRENIELKSELAKAKQTPPMSERFALKMKVVQGLMQLAGMEDIRNLEQ